MERPDDIVFSGGKVGKDSPPGNRRRTPRAKASKPPRPAPPAQTDSQRREARESNTRNPFQERNNLYGTGDTRQARSQRRRNRMTARQTSRDGFSARQAAASTPEPAPSRPRRRRLRPKPSRPS